MSDEVKLAAFRKIMGDPTMPPDEHQDSDYDEWLFGKAWDEAVLAERERCAAIATYTSEPRGNDPIWLGDKIAAAIRKGE